MSIESAYLHPKNWLTLLGFGFLRLVSLLPLPVIAAIGTAFGTLLYYAFSSRRNIALRNVSACFKDMDSQQRVRIVRRCFQLITQTMLSVGVGWWAPEARLVRLTHFIGREHYDKAVADGRNVILLAPHVIALEIAGLVLSRERPMISMYQRTKKPLFDSFVEAGRGRFGGIMVERKDSMRNLIRLVRKHHPFYYLPDQDAGRKGIFVPFFDQQASTIPMLSKFSQITEAVVIPCFTRIRPYGRGWEVVMGPALSPYPSGDEYADTRQMNAAIETLVRQTPEQYFWVHKRFKTQPDGAPPFYGR